MAVAKSRLEKSAEAFRSIGEAAGELGLQTHVLRYWEGKFPKLIKPIKRADGRRLFRPEDMEALRAVRLLVHERGMTLKGAKTLLAEQGVDAVLSGEARLAPPAPVEEVKADRDVETRTSPARALQASVEAAFAAQRPDGQLDAGATERLEGLLSDITDLKHRLDAARLRKAA